MFFQLKMAYLNIWRRSARTFAIIVMINFGILGLLFTQGVYRGMIDQMLYDTIRTGTGHITLHDSNYRNLKRISDTIENPGKITSGLKKDPMVNSFIIRRLHNGMISTARATRPVTMIGMDPANENKFGNLEHYMESGTYHIDPEKNEIIIGSELAKKLKTKVGKKIVIQTQGSKEAFISAAFRIGGIIRTNNPQIDLSGVFLTTEQFNSFIGTKNNPHQISILLHNEEDLSVYMGKLKEQLPSDISIYSWKKLNPMASMSRDIIFQMEAIIYAIIFVLVAIAIFDIMLVSILERVREFGIMMAIGTSFPRIAGTIFLESFVIGGLGFLAGAFTSLLMLLYLQKYGIDLQSAASGMAKMGMASIIYAKIELSYFISALVATLSSTMLASVVPIFILKRLKPMQAIYFT